ncbi:hypothetical protein GCM10010289_35080 [Streptomyces violascens]|uniref:Transposase n=1 Tax=Streptomyces violascens TaxID=67381 RepID=A0ABQ3R1B7_9ACTN|nr:hypothetical protein GCM10010289_35080 [Streptomyces violascens]GHI43331.1 hypothetical protein Sviol_77390 [Streptomyces violascens]
MAVVREVDPVALGGDAPTQRVGEPGFVLDDQNAHAVQGHTGGWKAGKRPPWRWQIGTPLDRVLITVLVSLLALPTGECQVATGRSGTRDDGSTWSPPQTVNPVRSPKGETGS